MDPREASTPDENPEFVYKEVVEEKGRFYSAVITCGPYRVEYVLGQEIRAPQGTVGLFVSKQPIHRDPLRFQGCLVQQLICRPLGPVRTVSFRAFVREVEAGRIPDRSTWDVRCGDWVCPAIIPICVFVPEAG